MTRYTTTEEGIRAWRRSNGDESIKKQAQQQIIILCEWDGSSTCGMTTSDLVHDFSLPFPGSESVAALNTRSVFDYAIDNIERLVNELMRAGHLEIHEEEGSSYE